jgi:hypothetical protein
VPTAAADVGCHCGCVCASGAAWSCRGEINKELVRAAAAGAYNKSGAVPTYIAVPAGTQQTELHLLV